MKVKVVEVGLRDGLQNESQLIPAETKVQIAEKLIHAGVRELEVTSFVHPKWIPQLADAEKVLAQLPKMPEVRYRALVPNLQGLKRAKGLNLAEIAIFLSASETHNQRNVNRTIAETLEILAEVCQEAGKQNLPVRAYLSMVFGCPYEGKVPLSQIENLCAKLFSLGVYEVSLGDTLGVATPNQVREALKVLTASFPADRLAVHFHDTYGCALANVYVALEAGIKVIDSSVGGMGGCPYAKGASGNLATEDLVYFLHGMGVETGIDLDGICQVSIWLEQLLGRSLPSKVLQAWKGTRRDSA
jgi:hydroxymethylglutaryl-CoA lyase